MAGQVLTETDICSRWRFDEAAPDPEALRRVDAVVLQIARLIGRRLAREDFAARIAANDNQPGQLDEQAAILIFPKSTGIVRTYRRRRWSRHYPIVTTASSCAPRRTRRRLLTAAAAHERLDVTSFILRVALPAARDVIERAERISLSERDSLRVLDPGAGLACRRSPPRRPRPQGCLIGEKNPWGEVMTARRSIAALRS